MRILLLFLGCVLLFTGCKKSAIEKPENLIDEDVMVSIFYDLALLEAIKSQNPESLETNHIDANNYIYKKYKIDSLQFAKSNRYYASEIKKYKRMYKRVNDRLQRDKEVTDSLLGKKMPKKNPEADPDAPVVR